MCISPIKASLHGCYNGKESPVVSRYFCTTRRNRRVGPQILWLYSSNGLPFGLPALVSSIYAPRRLSVLQAWLTLSDVFWLCLELHLLLGATMVSTDAVLAVLRSYSYFPSYANGYFSVWIGVLIYYS